MFELSPLPYTQNALEPHMSAETLKLHHGKHHKASVDKLNELTEGTDMGKMDLEELILKVHGQDDATDKKIFNNAAQVWNHDFFWQSMTPDGGGKPDGRLAEWIDRDLGGFDAFKEDFSKQAVDHFGSGWAWLAFDNDRLEILTTHDADLPLTHGKIALLTCDLWEHAYYVDHRNKRPEFIETFLKSLANWQFAGQQLEAATLEAVEG